MRRVISILVPLLIFAAAAPVAHASWSSSGSDRGAAVATFVNEGNTPSTGRDDGKVSLSWGASTLASGDAVGFYDVFRFDGEDSLPVCEGVTETLCIDEAPLPGPVTYSVVPRIGAHWMGPASAPAPFTYDNVAPVTSLTRTPVANEQGWNTGDVSVTLSAVDPGPTASGVKEIHYSVAGVDQPVVTGSETSFVVSQEDVTAIAFRAIDEVGNAEAWNNTEQIKIDRTAPVSSGELVGDTLSLSATDAEGSGVARIEYKIGSTGSTYTVYGSPLALTSGQTVYFHAVDVAGNVEPDHEVTYTAAPTDTQKPVTTVSSSPTPNGAGWTTANTTLTLTSTDNVAVAKLEYRSNPSDPYTTITGAGPYTLPVYTAEGITTVQYRATDSNGNVEDLQAYTVKVDKTAPGAPTSKPANGVSITNNNSGNSSWDKVCDGSAKICATPATDVSGTSSVSFTLAGTSAANNGKCWTGTAFQSATSCTALSMTKNETTGQYESAPIAQSHMLDGSYRLVLVVSDGAGLTTTTTVNFSMS